MGLRWAVGIPLTPEAIRGTFSSFLRVGGMSLIDPEQRTKGQAFPRQREISAAIVSRMMARPWGRPRCPLLSGNNAGPAMAAINAPTATGSPALSDRNGSTAFSKTAWMRAADGASAGTDFPAIGVPELSRQNRNRLFVPNDTIW